MPKAMSKKSLRSLPNSSRSRSMFLSRWAQQSALRRAARPQLCRLFAYPVIQSAQVWLLVCRGREATSPGSRYLPLTTAQSGWSC